MAGLQSWRRHTQLTRPTDNARTCHSQINDVAPSDDTSYSLSPGANESKLRPRSRRSLATFASSYLGTHHRIVSPSSGFEWPSIDWSKLSINDKQGDYKRDTEIMCTTITQQVLANPSTNLPAQYNTFLLHLIEAYHQSKVDVQDLQMKLAEQTKSDNTNVDGFHGEISSWPRETTRKPESLESPENANSKEGIATRVQQYNPAIQIPLSSIDKEKKGKKQGHADKIKTMERHQLMSSASSHRDPCIAAIGVEPSHDHWPPSPVRRGIELIDCDSSSPDSEGEGPRVLMSASAAVLDFKNDITPHIASWLALRQQSDVIAELSELVRSVQEEMQNGPLPITTRPNMAAASSGINQRLQGQRPDKLIRINGSLSCQPIREPRHRRGFSFLPGDDFVDRIVSKASGDQALNSDTSFFRPLAWQETKHSEHDESSESSKDELSGVMPGDSKPQPGLLVVSSSARSGVSRNPQRDRSGNSFLTSITSSSGRSLSRPHRGSLSSIAENNGLRVGSNRLGSSQLAVAAARAAKNGTVDRGVFHRESSS